MKKLFDSGVICGKNERRVSKKPRRSLRLWQKMRKSYFALGQKITASNV
jgi:uncharacterized protein YjiS (DUF1127 family)